MFGTVDGALFFPKKTVASNAAAAALSGVCGGDVGRLNSVVASLRMRHVRGDWGDAAEDHKVMSEHNLQNGGALLSVFTIGGIRFVFCTDDDRKLTFIALPEEWQNNTTMKF